MAQLSPTKTAKPPLAVEAEVRRELLAEDGLRFSSLVVRRVANGICLEGVLETHDEGIDVTSAALRITGVGQIQNELLVRNADSPPAIATPARRPR